ncbi:TIGR03747 family integrating conjugative element membrane protein [Salmonella enterica]|nr:TIGR03747 family integrating conjugative element membrane protein [Salmonella enterica]ELI6861928.1 TIGR03747 family integrating conjugative element membrane protein [Salmonella enterica]
MSPSDPSTNPPTSPPGLVAWLLSLPGKLLALVLGALLLSLCMEWAGMALLWQAQGTTHSRMLLEGELANFSARFTGQVLLSAVQETGLDWLEKTQRWMTQGIPARWRQPQGQASLVIRGLAPWFEAAMFITLTILLRLLILLLTLPLFALTLLVGVVDGLARRDIRRFGSGYESGFVHRHTRRMSGSTLKYAWFIYLVLPVSIPPGAILLPAAVWIGVMASLAVGSFKRYV